MSDSTSGGSERSGTAAPEVWRARLETVLPEVGDRFVDLARRAANKPEARLGADGWTVEETIRHVLTHFWRNTWDARTEDTLERVDKLNAVALAETYAFDLDQVLDQIGELSDAVYRRGPPSTLKRVDSRHPTPRDVPTPLRARTRMTEIRYIEPCR